MQYKSIKGYTGVGQLGMLLLFLGAGLILTTVVQLIITLQMVPAGTSFSELESALKIVMRDPRNIDNLRLLQTMGTFCLLFIPTVVYSWVCNGKDLFWLGFNKHFTSLQVLFGFLIIFAANIMAGPFQEMSEKIVAHFPSLNAIAKNMEDTYNEQVNMLSHLNGISDLLLAIVIMAFFPALFEELFFRGALQQLFSKWWRKPILAIIVSSLIFSLIHMSVYLFISRFVLGFALGMMYHITKNIWVNTIAHFLNNTIAVFQMYMLSNAKEKIDVSKLDPKVDWWVGVIALVILIVLFVFLKKHSKKEVDAIESLECDLITEHQQSTIPFN